MGGGRLNGTGSDVPDCTAKTGTAPTAENARRNTITRMTLDIAFMGARSYVVDIKTMLLPLMTSISQSATQADNSVANTKNRSSSMSPKFRCDNSKVEIIALFDDYRDTSEYLEKGSAIVVNPLNR
jgi:hypothetical protein